MRISGVDIGYVEAVSREDAATSESDVIEYTEIDEEIIGNILYNIVIYLRQKAGLPAVNNTHDLSELKNTIIFFIGEEVKKNGLAFRSALDKLGETNFVVILAADSQERDMLNSLIFGELGIPLERFRVMSFGEAGIDPSKANSYLMQILGLDNIHCIPCTPVKLRLHPELKEAEKRV